MLMSEVARKLVSVLLEYVEYSTLVLCELEMHQSEFGLALNSNKCKQNTLASEHT